MELRSAEADCVPLGDVSVLTTDTTIHECDEGPTRKLLHTKNSSTPILFETGNIFSYNLEYNKELAAYKYVDTYLELWHNAENYENKVYTLPKHLDEKVAKLHLSKIGVELEELSKDQADYIGVKVEGPYKPEYYRY